MSINRVSVSHSVVPNSETPWTETHQAPLSMRFSRQGYWRGLPFPFPGDLPNPGIEPGSPALQAYSLLTELPGKPINRIMALNYSISVFIEYYAAIEKV